MSVSDKSWAGIRAWGDAQLGDPLAGGPVNHVREVFLDGHRRVARMSSRGTDDLDWEIDLLGRLRASGLDVPHLVPTVDGRFRSGRMVVMDWVDGVPAGEGDSAKVGDYLRRLHELTAGWDRQRPGWRTCAELMTGSRSGPVDLSALPPDVVERCRGAWYHLSAMPLAVVHGDPTPPNVRVSGDRVTLLDWDEARIDVALMDLAKVPAVRAELPAAVLRICRQASCAWDAALFWTVSPAYARQQLALVETA